MVHCKDRREKNASCMAMTSFHQVVDGIHGVVDSNVIRSWREDNLTGITQGYVVGYLTYEVMTLRNTSFLYTCFLDKSFVYTSFGYTSLVYKGSAHFVLSLR